MKSKISAPLAVRMTAKSVIVTLAACGAFLLAGSLSAPADVIVYTGYFDLPPPSGGNNNPLPNPWLGSPNTTFFGDPVLAASSDPDEAAVRIQNTGPVSVTLNQGFVMGGLSAWDSFIGPAGFVIAPGANVVLSGTTTQSTDGSDGTFSNLTVTVVINGQSRNFTDSGVLTAAGLPSANETSPWTQVGQISAAVPGPVAGAGLPGLIAACGGLLALARRRRQLVVC